MSTSTIDTTNRDQFLSARWKLEKGRTRPSRTWRRVANNTYLHRDREGAEETIYVRLHATNIVALHADGRIVLNSGGWQTVTTKARMNEYLPAGVSLYQKDHVWYVEDRRFGETRTHTYREGIVILPDLVSIV